MRYHKWDIKQLRDISKNRKLICYGAGMVAHHIEAILNKYSILDNILFFVDRDEIKRDSIIKLSGYSYQIKPIEELYNDMYKDVIMLITCESYKEIITLLSNDFRIVIKDVCTYWDINNQLIDDVVKNDKFVFGNKEAQIPAKIHYCWFGKKDIPDQYKRYIDNWSRLCPEYEVCFWNETNYDINKCRYMVEAYENNYFAFVADYARMDIIYKYGGFYFDTDVELIKNLDELRGMEIFFTYGRWPAINSGSGFGAIKKHPIIKEIRDNPRAYISFLLKNGRKNLNTNCYYETEILKKYGFQMDFTSQEKSGIYILSPKFFPPMNYLSEKEVPKDTIALHKDAGSWKGII